MMENWALITQRYRERGLLPVSQHNKLHNKLTFDFNSGFCGVSLVRNNLNPKIAFLELQPHCITIYIFTKL